MTSAGTDDLEKQWPPSTPPWRRPIPPARARRQGPSPGCRSDYDGGDQSAGGPTGQTDRVPRAHQSSGLGLVCAGGDLDDRRYSGRVGGLAPDRRRAYSRSDRCPSQATQAAQGAEVRPSPGPLGSQTGGRSCLKKPPNQTAADILTGVGRVLFDRWQAGLRQTINIRRDTLRRWRSGHLPLGADHGVFDEVLALVERRETELRTARDELKRWLKKYRTPKGEHHAF